MNKEKFLAELKRQRPKKHNFSVIGDLENKTQNTYEEIKDFRMGLAAKQAENLTTLEGFQDRIFNEELNEYSDINNKLLDVGIAGTDFTVAIDNSIENSIAEIDNIKQLLNF